MSLEGDFTVRLVEDQTKFGRYATLSHCWGGQLSCITTTKNSRERTVEIPWTELPQTFQDAIRYCLKLEIPYIWIDALCILQDDPTDWQVESSKMADIYQNSYITLAATSASCGAVGCFPKEMTENTHRIFQMETGMGMRHLIGVRHKLSHWDDIISTAASQEYYPLLSRGWVFQERLLSPRVLHFARGELIWECGVETICECGSLTKDEHLKGRFALVLAGTRYWGSIDGGGLQAIGYPGLESEDATNEFEGEATDPTDLPRVNNWEEDGGRKPALAHRQEQLLPTEPRRRSQASRHNAGPLRLDLGPEDFRSRRYDRILSFSREANLVRSLLEDATFRISSLAFARSRSEGFLRHAQSQYSDLKELVQEIPPTEQDRATDLWHEIVAQFSSLRLTKILDRLPALSGLAERIQPFLGRYIAGLWGSSLPYDMAWRVEHLTPDLQRPNEYRGPSWSWVSVNAKVSFWKRAEMSPLSIFTWLGEALPNEFYTWAKNLDRLPLDSDPDEEDQDLNPYYRQLKPKKSSPLTKPTPTFAVLSCKVEKTGRNPYGEVSSVILTVAGLAQSATFLVDSAAPSTKGESQPLMYGVDIKFTLGGRGARASVHSVRLPFFADYNLTSGGPYNVPDNSTVLLLMLFKDISLVLVKEPVLLKGVEVYRRIGLLRLAEEYTLRYGVSLSDGSQRKIITII